MYTRAAGISDKSEDEDALLPDEDIILYDPSAKSNGLQDKQQPINYNFKHSKGKELLEDHVIAACTNKHVATIEEYLESHDVNDSLHSGWTLLMYAALNANLTAIKFLLKRGADPDKHKDGFTPLMALSRSTQYDCENNLNCLSALIEAEANVNAITNQRQTALMYACESRDVKFVEELLKHASNINATDNDGYTALMYAVIADKRDIVKVLLAHKADVTIGNRHGLTAQKIARVKARQEVLDLLPVEDKETETVYNISEVNNWHDLLVDTKTQKKDEVNKDVVQILQAMDFFQYIGLFTNMNISRFLRLTEEELLQLGIDISVHREQFLENLYLFHRKKWHVDSIGGVNKSMPYTIYDGIILSNNIAQQLSVIESCFLFVKWNIEKYAAQSICFTPEEKSTLEGRLEEGQKKILLLTYELTRIKNFAKKIHDNDTIGLPPCYIGPEKRKSYRAVTTLSASIIIGAFLFFTKGIKGCFTYNFRLS